MIDISTITGFEWDEGNRAKNWMRHEVSTAECEQTFLNEPLFLMSDESHSQSEERYFALGQTSMGRLLFVAFTIRHHTIIRVISARDMNRKERSTYEKKV